MSYKCLECGHIFEEGEQAFWNEYGEYWGTPFSQRMSGCPICKGTYEETVGCEICGSQHLEKELTDGVCDECIGEYRNDFTACYDLFVGEKMGININPVLASLLDDADIEQILKEHIRERMSDIDCSPFIDENKEWFAEKLLKEVNRSEKSKKQS